MSVSVLAPTTNSTTGDVALNADKQTLASPKASIKVVAPPLTNLPKAGFMFSLPGTLLRAIESSLSMPSAMSFDGAALPSWLRFDARSGSFTASNIPEGALPFQVLLKVDGEETLITISADQS